MNGSDEASPRRRDFPILAQRSYIRVLLPRGTEGSNPAPSSGESIANLTSSKGDSNRWHTRHAAMAPFSTQPPQESPLQQFGVEPIGLCPAVFPRNCHTRRMDHVRLYPARREPARQPEAVATGFKNQCNPRDSAAGP